LSEIGFSLRELGQTAESEAVLKQGLALSEKLGDSFDLVQSLNGLAVLYLGKDEAPAWNLGAEYAARAVTKGDLTRSQCQGETALRPQRQPHFSGKIHEVGDADRFQQLCPAGYESVA
jgi:hypothetical protein